MGVPVAAGVEAGTGVPGGGLAGMGWVLVTVAGLPSVLTLVLLFGSFAS